MQGLKPANQLRAVVLDMDGVLVDSEIHWKRVESKFLGGLVPGWGAEDQQSIIGMSAYDVHARLVANYSVTLSRDDFLNYYGGLSQQIYGVESSLISGALEFIEMIHKHGLPLGVASSSPHAWIDIVLDRFELRRFFSSVVSSDDFQGKGKPAPDIYLRSAELLGVEAEHCFAVEDTSKGIASAKAARMKCAGLLNGFNSGTDLTAADFVADGFKELEIGAISSLWTT